MRLRLDVLHQHGGINHGCVDQLKAFEAIVGHVQDLLRDHADRHI